MQVESSFRREVFREASLMITGRNASSTTPRFPIQTTMHRTLSTLLLCLMAGLGSGLAEESPALPGPEADGELEEQTTTNAAEAFRFGGAETEKAGELPEFSRVLSYRAAVAFSKADWKTAKEAYLEILEKHPDNPLALTNLATVEHRTGESSSALVHLDRAVAINPAIPQAWILKGLIHFEEGDGNLAVSALTRALHEDPLDPRPHNYLGVVIKDLGWLHGAEQELRRAIELDSSYADAHFNLALLYLDRVPPARELARRHYDRALELGSTPDKLAEQKIRGERGGGRD